MRNVVGSPAEGDDFFGREDEIERFIRRAEESANVLLGAPRRVGKTSLVLEVIRRWKEDGNPATFFNVEGCHDEVSFVERMLEALDDAGLKPGAMGSVAKCLHSIRKALGGVKAGAAGLNAELGEEQDGTVRSVVEDILARVNEDERPLLIVVDELPEMFLNFTRLSLDERGDDRVSLFLHWLRQLRQTYRKQVRWIFLGSIGLDGFVEQRGLRKTVNDLVPETLSEFPADVADRFLIRLGEAHNLVLTPDVRHQVIARVGALPYHLQLVFQVLRDAAASKSGPLSKADVDPAIDMLLEPQRLSSFETWRQRLRDQLPADDDAAAKRILDEISKYPDGKTRAQLLANLRAGAPASDAVETEERLARLLHLFQCDGYLILREDAYVFRSFLLREFWRRRYVR